MELVKGTLTKVKGMLPLTKEQQLHEEFTRHKNLFQLHLGEALVLVGDSAKKAELDKYLDLILQDIDKERVIQESMISNHIPVNGSYKKQSIPKYLQPLLKQKDPTYTFYENPDDEYVDVTSKMANESDDEYVDVTSKMASESEDVVNTTAKNADPVPDRKILGGTKRYKRKRTRKFKKRKTKKVYLHRKPRHTQRLK